MAPGLANEYYMIVEVNGSAKHTSLLWYGNNYCSKKFYSAGTWFYNLISYMSSEILCISTSKVSEVLKECQHLFGNPNRSSLSPKLKKKYFGIILLFGLIIMNVSHYSPRQIFVWAYNRRAPDLAINIKQEWKCFPQWNTPRACTIKHFTAIIFAVL